MNAGLPVWHASVSLQSAGSFLRSPSRLERAAVAELRGVGGVREWWFWNPRAAVGHLRVAVTDEEYRRIPPGCALSDAGEAGPERRRTP